MSVLSQASVAKSDTQDTKRGPWNSREDQDLLNLVRECGPHNWVDISSRIKHRTPKQCRERYHQNLKPTLDHSPITFEEGLRIVRYFQELGPKWAEIARHLQGRSDNSIKNWWNGSVNRRRRQEQHEKRKQEIRGLRSHHRDPVSGQLRSVAYGLSHQTPLPPLYIPNNQQYPTSLRSPARSESAGEAPSLVSDSSTRSTPSPKTVNLPIAYLPPMTTMNEDTRRSNVLRLHTSSTSFEFNPSRPYSNGRQPNREHYDYLPKPSSLSSSSIFRGSVSEPASASSHILAQFNSHQSALTSTEPASSGSYRFSLFNDGRTVSRTEEPLSPRSCRLPPIGQISPTTTVDSQAISCNTTTEDRFIGRPEHPEYSSKVSVKSMLC